MEGIILRPDVVMAGGMNCERFIGANEEENWFKNQKYIQPTIVMLYCIIYTVIFGKKLLKKKKNHLFP